MKVRKLPFKKPQIHEGRLDGPLYVWTDEADELPEGGVFIQDIEWQGSIEGCRINNKPYLYPMSVEDEMIADYNRVEDWTGL